MDKSTNDNKELVAVEKILNPTQLKQFATKGEQGQFIELVDLDLTTNLLKEIAEKSKGLVITKDNYKKEGVLLERELRQNRYALQKINKSNTAFLNTVKTGTKETFTKLIDIIKPEEDRLAKEIAVFKKIAKDAKEEKEKAEAARIEKIEKALQEAELALEKAIAIGKTQEDIEEYDRFMAELKGRFETFEEMEFKAKKIYAIYTAKRRVLVKQVNEFIQLAKDKREREEREEKEKQNKAKIYKIRQGILTKSGLELRGGKFVGFGLSYPVSEIRAKDELQWFELVDKVQEAIVSHREAEERREKSKREKEEKQQRDILLKAIKDWEDLLTIYEGLGCDVKVWRLPKNQIPNQKDIKGLTAVIKEEHRKQRELLLDGVKSDLNPYKEDILEFYNKLELDIKEGDLKNGASKDILESYLERSLLLLNEVFGEVSNK